MRLAVFTLAAGQHDLEAIIEGWDSQSRIAYMADLGPLFAYDVAPEAVTMQSHVVVDGVIVPRPAVPDVVELPAFVSKLAFRDELVARGMWADALAFINADADRAERFSMASTVARLDPGVTTFIAGAGLGEAFRDLLFIAMKAREAL